MNKSLISGFIGGLLAASLFVLPGWVIFLILWFGVGFFTLQIINEYCPPTEDERIPVTIFITLLGFASLLFAFIFGRTEFIYALWSYFTDSPPPKFRSPIYFEEEKLTKE